MKRKRLKGQQAAWNEEELGKKVRGSFEEFGKGKCREGKSWRRRKGSAKKGSVRGFEKGERENGNRKKKKKEEEIGGGEK